MAIALTFIVWLFVLVVLFGTSKAKRRPPAWQQILLGLFVSLLFVMIFLVVEFGLDILDILERLLIRLSRLTG